MVPPRMNFLTLARRDVERMAGFFVAWKVGSSVDESGSLIWDPAEDDN